MIDLGPEAVHVWAAALDATEWFEPSRAVLSSEERDRAERFRFDHLQRRFVISHGFLRSVLAGYLQVQPSAILFQTGEHGKPFISGTELQFNLSHSGDLAVCAVTLGRRVGVDVECTRPVQELEAIVARFFAPGEAQRIRSAANHERAFFECWTRKEAYIKGVGGGFSIPLTSFDTSAPVPGWSLADLPDLRECVGAVAVQGAIRPLLVRQWPSSAGPAL